VVAVPLQPAHARIVVILVDLKIEIPGTFRARGFIHLEHVRIVRLALYYCHDVSSLRFFLQVHVNSKNQEI
jgi:hypothetical protein